MGLAALLLAGAPAVQSEATTAPPCIPVAGLISPAAFRKYPAGPLLRGPWRRPDVRRGVAHRYRTVLREEGVGPPDFAGHLKVVSHGCGAGLTCPLFVDLKTGKVLYLPALGSVAQPYDVADVPGIDDLRLVHRADSRLLVAVGARNESERLAGATMFEWRGDRLHLRRFIPDKALCLDSAGLGGMR